MKNNISFILYSLIGLLFISFTAVSCVSDKENTQADPQISNLDIYLLIGQSNMAGRAVLEAPDLDTLDRVYLYTGRENDEWEKAANPLNKYSSIRKKMSMQRLSPGYTFAKEMAKNTSDQEIGIVVNAKGGSSINLWAPGTEFYEEAVNRTKDALRFGTLKGIAWHQGESDATKFDTYMPKMIELIDSLRAEFQSPQLPFVVGQLSPDKDSRLNFNQMILELPSKVENASVVSTEGTTTTDSTHFDAVSQRLLGERYSIEMLKLLEKE